eukprot:TRINITY_DN5731_c0_g3_i1.p3 TRINITY_DN5731_c0_g3~~TRINITY_DN5731_c0_g3_i1.p3  ORF type:complete len:254 (-),score=18.60 TRINITY_DN5731_c0_g3_i1:1458-2219(-)
MYTLQFSQPTVFSGVNRNAVLCPARCSHKVPIRNGQSSYSYGASNNQKANRFEEILENFGWRSRRTIRKLDQKFGFSRGFRAGTKGVQEQIEILNGRFNLKHKFRVFQTDCERLFSRFYVTFKKYFRLLISSRYGRLLLTILFFYGLFSGFLPRLFFWFLQINFLLVFLLLPMYRMIRGKQAQQYGQRQQQFNTGSSYAQYQQARRYQQQYYQQYQQRQQQQSRYGSQQNQSRGESSQKNDGVIDAQWTRVDD